MRPKKCLYEKQTQLSWGRKIQGIILPKASMTNYLYHSVNGNEGASTCVIMSVRMYSYIIELKQRRSTKKGEPRVHLETVYFLLKDLRNKGLIFSIAQPQRNNIWNKKLCANERGTLRPVNFVSHFWM